MALALSFSNPRSDPHSQAGASLVWGHEKFEFEDDQGFQWRTWFNECGRAFKIKAAWGHPDIVRGARIRRAASINTDCDYLVHLYSWALVIPLGTPISTQRTRTITITHPLSAPSSSASSAALSSGSRVRRSISACVVSSLPPFPRTTSAQCTRTSTMSPAPSRARIANEIHASGKSSLQLNILDYT